MIGENSLKRTLLVEKYRPTNVEEFVGNEDLKVKLNRYIENKDIPHLLFYGKPGTGKTSAAKMLVNSIDCDYMIINASDENNVETVRTTIKNFATSVGFKPLKIMVLDECDYISVSGQAILRNLMETYSQYCRFILTCNYIEKVIEPIQSRCEMFQFFPPSKKEVAVHVGKILSNEGITYDPKDLAHIIVSLYPDIRKIINTCSSRIVDGELKLDVQALIENDYRQKIVDIFLNKNNKQQKYEALRKTIVNAKVTDYSDLFSYLYEKVDEYGSGKSASIILTLAEGQLRHAQSIDKEIAVMATLIEILNLI